MDPEIQEIITRFKLLDTTSARRAAYHRIIDHLNLNEWRDVKERINERSFQKDVLGALPLEIALQVIQRLNLSDIHSLRRVSRRWCDILSWDFTCSVLFRQHTGASIDRLHGDIKSTLARYSKTRFHLEQGVPLEEFHLDTPVVSDIFAQGLDYSHGRLVWSGGPDTAIVIHDLRSQEKKTLYTENRDRCYSICITEKMVSAITMRGSVNFPFSMRLDQFCGSFDAEFIMWQPSPCLGPSRQQQNILFPSTQYRHMAFCCQRLQGCCHDQETRSARPVAT